MEDRPIVAFQNDSMPNRFWGRGIAEKGYNMQKAIDAQIRAHLDSLALTTVPMMGIDATRLPRGAKFEVRPGKTILTNGNPAEILQPFKFGNTDPGNLQIAGEFMRMMLMATGTVDSSTMPAPTTADGAGMSAGLSAIIKKNKGSLNLSAVRVVDVILTQKDIDKYLNSTLYKTLNQFSTHPTNYSLQI